MRNPAKQSAGTILREGTPTFIAGDGRVRVRNGGRREEDGRARRELDDEAKVPEYKVAALIRVEVSQSSHSAPPVREVCKVPVLLRHDLRSEVDRCGGPDAVGEVAGEGRGGPREGRRGFSHSAGAVSAPRT